MFAFFLYAICSQSELQLPPVKKQIVLAQGQKTSLSILFDYCKPLPHPFKMECNICNWNLGPLTSSSGYCFIILYWKFTKAPLLFLVWSPISSSQFIFYYTHLKNKQTKQTKKQTTQKQTTSKEVGGRICSC